jgi:hypothetical protein
VTTQNVRRIVKLVSFFQRGPIHMEKRAGLT